MRICALGLGVCILAYFPGDADKQGDRNAGLGDVSGFSAEDLWSSLLVSVARTNDSCIRFYPVYYSAWPLPVLTNQGDTLHDATGAITTSLHPEQGWKERYQCRQRNSTLPVPGPMERPTLLPPWLRVPCKWDILCYGHHFKYSNGKWTFIQNN